MEKTFNFKICDIVKGFKKGTDTPYYKVICYCNFGFITNFFLNAEKMQKLSKLQEQKDFNINNYIQIFYDNTKQNFAYIIKL